MEKTIKNILVHCDNNDTMKNVLDVAFLLSSIYDSKVTIANISEKKNEEAFKNKVEQALKDVDKPLPKNIDFMVKEGKSFKEIVSIANEIHADSIIINNEVPKGFHFFDENTPYKAAMNAPCPVITIGNSQELKNIKKIVLPIDSTVETRQKIPMALSLVKHFDAELVLVGICEEKTGEDRTRMEHYLDQSFQFINEKGFHAEEKVIIHKDICNELIKYANSIQADIIMITAEDSTSGIFSQSYAEQIIHKSNIPVMSVQPKDLKLTYAAL